jgi:hypothetical protein
MVTSIPISLCRRFMIGYGSLVVSWPWIFLLGSSSRTGSILVTCFREGTGMWQQTLTACCALCEPTRIEFTYFLSATSVEGFGPICILTGEEIWPCRTLWRLPGWVFESLFSWKWWLWPVGTFGYLGMLRFFAMKLPLLQSGNVILLIASLFWSIELKLNM